jgi:tRNA threonylcarbamoyladenosine biosynthesis protein TsaB
MKFLVLHTCGAEGTVALTDTDLGESVTLRTMPGRSASEMLVWEVRQAMGELGWKMADLAAVGVVTGPGSFTGVRVGLSAAKGFAEATGVPVIGVSRLELLASLVSGDACDTGTVCALLDAGRGEFYCGVYGGKAGGESLVAKGDAVEAATRADVVAVCEEAVSRAISEGFPVDVAVRLVPEPTAGDAVAMVLRRYEAGSFEDPETLDANYLRRTDAEIFASPVGRRAG